MKDIGTIATKWSSRAGAAGSDYKDGVTLTTKDWAANTTAAKDSYAQGVQDAIGRGAFAAGVSKAGTPKWKAAASVIGAQRYPQGVAAGASAYATGFGLHAQALASLQYPPRGPKGSPQNIQRVATVATRLHQLKTTGA